MNALLLSSVNGVTRAPCLLCYLHLLTYIKYGHFDDAMSELPDVAAWSL
jgi:hypothetical protein